MREEFLGAHYARAKGKPLGKHDVLDVIRHCYFWDYNGKSLVGDSVQGLGRTGSRCARVAEMLGLSITTVKAIWDDWSNRSQLRVEDTSLRGAGSVLYPHAVTIDDTVKGYIRSYIDAVNLGVDRSEQFVTRRGIQSELFTKHGILLSLRRISHVLEGMGVEWGRLYKKPGGELTAARREQRAHFIVQYAHAVLRERAGKARIVYLDESYANARHNAVFGFRDTDRPYKTLLPTGKGLRTCFIKAVSMLGIVTKYAMDGSAMIPPPNDMSVFPSSDCIFTATKALSIGDYHGNFDAKKFQDWVSNRLLPALRAQFPRAFAAGDDYELFICMDNAPYHVCCKDGPDNFSPYDCSRAALIDRMAALGCTQLVVHHEVEVKAKTGKDKGKVIGKETVEIVTKMVEEEKTKTGFLGKRAGAPELRVAAAEWILENRKDVMSNWVETTLAAAGRIKVIWDVPMHPQLAPIELFWAQNKAYVALRYRKGRTMAQLIEDVQDGFYTDKYIDEAYTSVRGGHFVLAPGATACPEAAKIIEHVQKVECQKIIDADSRFGGTIFDLEVKDAALLARVLRSTNRNAQTAIIAGHVAAAKGAEAAADVADAADEWEEDEDADGDSDDE